MGGNVYSSGCWQRCVHTIGRFHHEVAGLKYVRSSRSEGFFGNQDYRDLGLNDDWMLFGNDCNTLGCALGERPKATWMANAGHDDIGTKMHQSVLGSRASVCVCIP